MNKTTAWIAAGAGAVFAFTAATQFWKGLKPSARFENLQTQGGQVIGDNQTGRMYTWLQFESGGWRFVELDRNKEEAVRKGMKSKSAPLEDILSGKKIIKEQTLKVNGSEFKVTSALLYRKVDGVVVYKVDIAAIPAQGQKCISKKQTEQVQNVFANEGSELALRLNDEEGFYVVDVKIPLYKKDIDRKGKYFVFDGTRDVCNNLSGLTYDGVAEIPLKDYEIANNAKLMLKKIKFTIGGAK